MLLRITRKKAPVTKSRFTRIPSFVNLRGFLTFGYASCGGIVLDWPSSSIQEIAQATGVFGAGLYICSYFMLQSGLIRGQGFLYPFLIIVAASSVLFSLTAHFNLAAAIIQTSFVSISIFGIIRMYLLTRAVRFSPDEQQFIDNYLTILRPHQARRLLNTASVETIQKGDCLIREGEIVGNLIYLLHGHVTVWMAGHQINACSDGQMIGELTFDTSMRATATVIADGPARCLVFDGVRLSNLMRRNQEINSALLASHFCSSREKLIDSNARHIEMFGTPIPLTGAAIPGHGPIHQAQAASRQP